MALLGEVGSIAMVILILYGLTSKSLVKTIILLMLLEGHYHGAGCRDKWSVNGIVTASSHNLSVPSTRTLLIDRSLVYHYASNDYKFKTKLSVLLSL